MIAHSLKDTITLREFSESGECPWCYQWLKQVASKAINGDPAYKHLPFIQPSGRRGGRIRVNVRLMRIHTLKGASVGYRKGAI